MIKCPEISKIDIEDLKCNDNFSNSNYARLLGQEVYVNRITKEVKINDILAGFLTSIDTDLFIIKYKNLHGDECSIQFHALDN